MSSVSSEDGSEQQSRLCGSYSLSADISESESCCSFSCRRIDAEGPSSSMSSSPLPVVDNFGAADSVMLPVVGGKDVVVWDDKTEKRCPDVSEFEMMKERFAKLLLGEDMSGAGKGVCSALTISNAITNLSASVFGELWRLEPLSPQKKAMWRREMEWFLCVSDSIVELVPTVQQFPGGGTYEVMTTRPRSDLYMNLPALKKLDSMLIAMLDGFHETEFWYVDRGIVVGDPNGADNFIPGLRASIRQEEKWWLPCPQISPSGLSEDARKRLQQYRDCANQILKAAMAINSSVLAEMEIPNAYLETLPKSGKACLGEVIYHYVADEQFSSDRLLECLDLSSEHHTLKVVNRIEAAVHVWKQKNQKKYNKHVKPRRPIWGGKVKSLNAVITEKNNTLAQRAETVLQCLRLRFPELPQTALDMTKIQYNKDIGQSILESYSRVTESLAFNIMARIDDVLYADDAIKGCAAVESMSVFSRGGLGGLPIQKRMSPSPFSIHNTPHGSPFATPTFCSSPPLIRSPGRMPSSRSNIAGAGDMLEVKSEKQLQADFEKVWLCSGNVSGRVINGNASERRE